MNLTHDRQITISVGGSRKATNWPQQVLSVAEFYAKPEKPIRSKETQQEYFGFKKPQQDELKDGGGFVGGSLSSSRRKSEYVIGRDVITLDFDNIPAYGTQELINKLEALNCGYCVYSTRKHVETKPRLRVLAVTDRTMTPEEYEPCARRFAEYIGIQWADPTTFEVARLMYWPTVSYDGEYVYKYRDAPFVSVDSLLGSYTDWKDITTWPQVPGTAVSYQKLAMKQGDPEAKPGVVGAFCRTYDIYRAMDSLIPGIYDPVDNDPNRYTYTGGSTTGGAVLYDNGKFLFSHHSTDPCSGKLVNSFDMVRLHKFGDLDKDAPEGRTDHLPSYKAMCEFAVADTNVAATMATERHDQAVKDFEGVPATNENDAANWMSKLQLHQKTGLPMPTIDNVMIILECDPLLKGKFALNQFAGRGEVLGTLPWSKDTRRRLWSDTDSNGLYWYLEKAYNITGRGNIDAALDIHAATHAFNEVQNYLSPIVWDGIPRLDTLFSDYLGAEDSPYTRAVCRKSFTAAVARAMVPGCKYDNMLILCGPQGIGKSTILGKMANGWFNDNIRTFEGKEASELLQGVWIVEVAELDAFRRTDVARIKQFLSLRADRYRAAYGRHVKELPRRCVFFGTCNEMEFLQDTTGNRRFWPVDVGVQKARRSVWTDLTQDIVDQIWGEAKARWQLGETTFLSGDIEAMAKAQQEKHREALPQEDMIIEFVEKQVPSDWSKWSLDKRRDFWAGATHGDIELVDRDRISAMEVWSELFMERPDRLPKHISREINAVLSKIPGWVKKDKIRLGTGYDKKATGFFRDHKNTV